MESKHELAAIMFTDIVGYTKMMGTDEQKALEVLKRNRILHVDALKRYRGQLLKEMGDGMLTSFPSAGDAVHCAAYLQTQLKGDKVLHLRIGIHIGDVVVQEGDILGDGVNIAARIEQMAKTGQILVSEAVYNSVRNRVWINGEFEGEFTLKNVNRPVKIYSLEVEQIPIPLAAKKKSRSRNVVTIGVMGTVFMLAYLFLIKPQQSKRQIKREVSHLTTVENSIAVLPFDNMSNDPEQEYFSDGMMDMILNHLYKIGGLHIPSRTSSMRYKDQVGKSIQEIGNELGVAHVLEGSVQKSGNRIKIIVQLIDVKSDKHLWSQDYEVEFKDVFAIQSDIAKIVAKELKTQIDPAAQKRIENVPTKNTEAYNLFLQARHFLFELSDYDKAKLLLDQALELDSSFAEPYVSLGYYWLLKGAWFGDMEPEELLKKALPLLEKAQQINENYPYAQLYLSWIHLWYEWDFDAAARTWDKFFQISPSNSGMSAGFCDFLNASGRSKEAVAIAEKAILYDPSAADSWEGTGLSYYFNGQPEKAVQHYETALKLFPNRAVINDLGRVYIYTEAYEKAIVLLENYIEKGDRFPRPLGNLAIAYYQKGHLDKTEKILSELITKSAKTPVGSPAFYIAMIYATMNEIDTAFDWLNKAYEDREVEMYWLKVEPPFQPLHSDPRWNMILQKVGFPD